MLKNEKSFEKVDLTFFERDLDALSIKLEREQISLFLDYYELLIQWNSFMNLTAITDFKEVLKKHFTDSLTLANYVDLTTVKNVIDVGTGAGFPGIPLKIAFPHLEMTLLDSLKKRVRFLNEVIEKLGLENVRAIHGRAEDMASGVEREAYDLCVSRAVANLSTLSEYCIPFVKIDGIFAPYKSEKVSQEFSAGKNAISCLGGEIEQQNDFLLPHSDIRRTILIVRKTKKTPIKFPRKAGIPSKQPLS